MAFSFNRSYESKPLPPKPTAVVLTLVGLVLLSFSMYSAFSKYKLVETGVHVNGIVIALERNGGSHFPVFTFTDNKNRKLEVRSSVSSNEYFVGDSIPIIYHPNSPLEAQLDEPIGLYLLSIITGGIGLAFLFGVFVLLKALPYFEAAYDRERARHE